MQIKAVNLDSIIIQETSPYQSYENRKDILKFWLLLSQ